MQVKIFQSGNINKLERELNDFLEENPHIEIQHIKQTGESYGDAEEILSLTTISIWYEE
ncbi:hypothetical protein [Enterococcus sp. DIV1420a]|uniref:hypothetical protein n=1 Tax=Enterococcus sp. DIV1420a TaxID=2774672 RepID=UPI003F2412F8